ncbi:hypothetical protein Ahy_B02g060565 [Arachis hypogaea]|uniref:Uncharacterized protein n=1 Tax=Arachis hypogaea TaxID=3818 RepID=A0A445AIT3_ARAHY|nr:hypothetical protein Ahy_B02g060565 [Arachis hypogaea]
MVKLGMIVDSVGNFFSRKDQLPWCDPDIVTGREREVARAGKQSDEFLQECLLRLSWALVNYKRSQDVQCGIADDDDDDYVGGEDKSSKVTTSTSKKIYSCNKHFRKKTEYQDDEDDEAKCS